MTRTLTYLSLALGALLAGAIGPASALAQKPGGGGSAAEVGDNLADLLSENLTQLLVVLVGVAAMATFWARSIGQAAMIVVGGLIAGLFIIEPDNAVSLFESAYELIV